VAMGQKRLSCESAAAKIAFVSVGYRWNASFVFPITADRGCICEPPERWFFAGALREGPMKHPTLIHRWFVHRVRTRRLGTQEARWGAFQQIGFVRAA
jgi:hypothetical protein